MDEKKDDEPIMYYMENGFVVFTAAYLLKRGTCCENGCRHCPYKSPKGAEPVSDLEKDSED